MRVRALRGRCASGGTVLTPRAKERALARRSGAEITPFLVESPALLPVVVGGLLWWLCIWGTLLCVGFSPPRPCFGLWPPVAGGSSCTPFGGRRRQRAWGCVAVPARATRLLADGEVHWPCACGGQHGPVLKNTSPSSLLLWWARGGVWAGVVWCGACSTGATHRATGPAEGPLKAKPPRWAFMCLQAH